MPYYYFQAGSAGRANGTRVGASLQIGEIQGLAFIDTDGDGIYSGADTPITNKTMNLYLLSGGTYIFLAETTTNASGRYTFSDL
jgi:hypothetical protein